MVKIDTKDYYLLKEEFIHDVSKYPLINSILSGLQSGYVYSDTKREILIVMSRFGFTLISFKQVSLDVIEKVFRFLQENTEIPNYLHVYSPVDEFLNYIIKNYSQYKLRDRMQYRYIKKQCDSVEGKLPKGYKVKTLKETKQEELEALPLDLYSRYWDSKEDFYQHAIGICIVDEDDSVAAICYSAAYVDYMAEMDTLVLEKYRGKGLMRLVSEPFYNLATSLNSDVHWDTFVDNVPSFILGEKFSPNYKNRYKLLSIFFDRS